MDRTYETSRLFSLGGSDSFVSSGPFVIANMALALDEQYILREEPT